jgi:hypothetical protein
VDKAVDKRLISRPVGGDEKVDRCGIIGEVMVGKFQGVPICPQSLTSLFTIL